MVLSTRHRAKRSTEPKEHKQQLINIPLDVLIEIFLLLEPLDLLHLARTTKGLREFLLNHRRSSALWKNAIGNVKDFPPCPDHMSAPAYTHLAFVPVCHGCFCPCETVEWELRMRCCPDCFPKMTTPRCSISYLNDLDLPRASTHYKLDDFGLDIIVSLEAVHPAFCISLLDWKVAQSRKRPRKVSTEEFLTQQNDFWGSIRRHAHSCQDWEHGRLEEKAAQLSLVRKQRVNDIKSELKKLGRTDIVSSIFHDNDLLRLPEARKLEPLTPTEWAKIRPQLISWARKIKQDWFRNHCIVTFTSVSLSIQQELKSDTSLKVQPRGIDIAMLPAVRLVLESNIHSDTSHDDLKKKFFRVLPPAIRKWSSDTVEELEQFSREQLSLPPLSKPSRLPSVIFRCKVCSRSHQRFRFDEALSHHHLYKERRKEDKRENTGEMSLNDKLVMGYRTCPRNIQALQVDITVSRRVENLVRRMGQNPSRVTYDELCHSTVKVICGLCRPEVATRMNFEHAFKHCLNTHLLGNKETEVWTRVSARE